MNADPSRDLRLGLRAFESGAIDRDRLFAIIKEWAIAGDRPLAALLALSGVVDAAAVARFEEGVDRDLQDLDRRKRSPTAPLDHAEAARAADTIEHVSRPGRAPAGVVGGHRFQIVRPHARGGLGEVFLAFDRELNRSVALKELQTRLAHDPGAQARFLLEAEITGMLAHPGIVPVYSLGRHEDGRPYYAMHLIEGETLRAAIDRFHQPTGETPRPEGREVAFRRLLRCVIDACNAVGYAHSRGVVHRDLKPENIMLGRFGETLVVDWGVAKVLPGAEAEVGETPEPGDSAGDASETRSSSTTGARKAPNVDKTATDPSMTQPGTLVGTPRFMSPEQAALDLDRVGAPSDIYSLGVILYCVLVGRDPFPEGDLRSVLRRVRRGVFPAPRRLNRSLDPALELICLKAMALNPVDRHASALELAGDLETWLADVRYRGEQELALGQVKGTLARLSLERAHHCFDRGAHPEGMLWLSRALENAPVDPPDLSRVIRTSLSAWHSGTKLLERSLRHGAEVHAVAFCPEGRILATAGADMTARLWDISMGSPLSPPLKHDGAVRAVAFSPSGELVATAGDDQHIRFWDARSGAPVGDPVRAGAPIDALIFNRDGSRMAAAGGSNGPFLWNAESLEPIRVLEGSMGRVRVVAFTPDGGALAVAFDDAGVGLFAAATGKRLGAPLAHESPVRVLEFDETGQRLLTATIDGDARLWDLDLPAPVVTLAGQGKIRCLAFRPDGELFATAFEDGAARLWESDGGRPIGELLDHRSRVDCLVFRTDGAILATGGSNGLVRLWCAQTGLPVGPPLEQGGEVRAMVFSHDGRRLATGGNDPTVRCWKTPTPLDADVERVSTWVRVTTDLQFDSGDAIQRMDGSTSWDLRRRLTELGGAPLK